MRLLSVDVPQGLRFNLSAYSSETNDCCEPSSSSICAVVEFVPLDTVDTAICSMKSFLCALFIYLSCVLYNAAVDISFSFTTFTAVFDSITESSLFSLS